MTKNKTKAYGQIISARLNDTGWELDKIEPETDWYAAEHWRFKSVRQAYGTHIYISFMVDPMCDAQKAIWCVRSGTNIPTYFHQSDGEIAELYMSRGMFDEKLDAFIKAINAHRNTVHSSTQKEEA